MNYVEEELMTPLMDDYDVIVVGGGPAGVGAALASARHGAKTLLVEQYGFLGGMWTAGMVVPIWDWENKGGIICEIIEHLKAENKTEYTGSLLSFDIEAMKVLLDEMMMKSGVTVLFHTWFSKPILKNNSVCGIITENKSGRQAWKAKCVIDCTGDGDVAARSGAKFEMGRPKDGATQPMSLMFKLGEMDYVQDIENCIKHYEKTELYSFMEYAVKKNDLKDYEFNFDRPYILSLPSAHQGIAEMVHVRHRSGINGKDLSDAEFEGRQLVKKAINFFKSYMPQFRHAYLAETASSIGVRESRRIIGEYKLTLEDVLEGKQFDDGICLCTFAIDIHQPDGISQEGYEYKTKPFQIPYRCLVPLKIDQLIIAGRCISGSYEAHASYRVTGDCTAMGQAAGVAAALAVQKKCKPRNISTKELQKLLKEDNVKIC